MCVSATPGGLAVTARDADAPTGTFEGTIALVLRCLLVTFSELTDCYFILPTSWVVGVAKLSPLLFLM